MTTPQSRSPVPRGDLRGRPRSERSRSAVLRSARLLLARDGLHAVTVEGIAADAGVSKATIYRWWHGKAAVVLDAVLDQVEQDVRFPDTGDLRADLEAEIRSVIDLYTGTDTGAAVLDLVAASRSDPDLADAMRERFFLARRAVAADYLARGVERGVLRPGLDVDVVIDAIWGALYYRLLVAHLPLTVEYATALVDQFWPVLEAPPAAPSGGRP